MQQFLSAQNLSEGKEKNVRRHRQVEPERMDKKPLQQLASIVNRPFLALGRVAIFAYLWRKPISGSMQRTFSDCEV
jgi:hypothetical protein